MAHAFIDAVADAGVDAVKFQTHIAAAESTRAEDFRVPPSPQDLTRYDYWKRMEFTGHQWSGLREHAEQRNLASTRGRFSWTHHHQTGGRFGPEEGGQAAATGSLLS